MRSACLTLSIITVLLGQNGVGFAAETPHILLILADDMGYGDPGCYNPASKISTPHIDSLATAGMRFTDAHAAGPLCHVSRYGLLTGRYPFRAQSGAWARGPVIDQRRMTIASLLSDAGYRTAMVGKWHLGFVENGYDQPLPGGPTDRGFDTFFGIRASTDIPPYFYIRNRHAVTPPTETIAANNSKGWSPIQGAFWRAGGIAPDLKLEEVTPRFTDEAVAVIERHAARADDKRLMLYLAYPSPHTPWLPSKEFQGKSKAGMYGDFTMMVDAHIGRVLASLEKAGMADDTLVIFSSDNGPVWYDADVRRLGHDSCGVLRGMKADAWEAGHRMPFIVRWPGKVKAGSVSDQMICFTDVLATFADVVGRKLPDEAGPDEAGPDSFSFLPALLGEQPEAKPIRTYLPIASGRGMMTIRRGPWKLITGLGSGGFSQPRSVKPQPGEPPMQLYDLSKDLSETTNLYTQHPEIVKELLAQLRRIREQ
ncbi:MAG: sulfatase-like hydrolase/transferase [Planctomycetes bacterium]|nr:sulfatase-like hydrolase/transferase [Planctomycetota bacterium]